MSLVLRTVKGSELTYNELDDNFTFLSGSILNLSSSIASLTGSSGITAYAEVPTITALKAYSGSATALMVTDPNKGGIFFYTASSLSNDDITRVVATGKTSGSYFRYYSGKVDARWGGATITGSATANGDIIESMIDAGYFNIVVPPSMSYDPTRISDGRLLAGAVVIEDQQNSRLSFGRSAALQFPISNDTHLSLRPLKDNKITGLWIGGKGRYPFTPDATGVYHGFKLSWEDFEDQLWSGSDNYGDATLILTNHGYNGFGSVRFNSKQNGNFAGDWAPMEFVFQNDAYRAMTVANLKPITASAGTSSYFAYGGRDKAFWYQGRPTTSGSFIVVDYRIYQAANNGTTGATIPTHSAGTISDGGVSWSYIENTAPNVTGVRWRPAVIFGDFDTDADTPAIGFNDAAVHFAERALIYPQQGFDFLNGSRNTILGSIEALSQTTPGLKFFISGAADQYLSISNTRVKINNLPLIPSLLSKSSSATIFDISTGSHVAFNDSVATTFANFTNGINGQFVTAFFNTANTILSHSSNLRLGGQPISMSANSMTAFYSNGGSVATMISALPLPGSTNYIQNERLLTQSANLNISGTGSFGDLIVNRNVQFNVGSDAGLDMYFRNSSTGNLNRLAIGNANELLGVANGGTSYQYKNITGSNGIVIIHSGSTIIVSGASATVSGSVGISGSGADGRLAYWSGSGFVTGSADDIVKSDGSITLSSSAAEGFAIYNTVDRDTSYERVVVKHSGTTALIGTEYAGTGTSATVMRVGIATTAGAGISSGRNIVFRGSTNPVMGFEFGTVSAAGTLVVYTGSITGTSNTQSVMTLSPTISQSSAAGYDVLFLRAQEARTGSGVKYLIRGEVNGTDRFIVDNLGSITMANTAVSGCVLYNTADQTASYERGVFRFNSNVLEIGTEYSGSASARALRIGVVSSTGGTFGIGRNITIQGGTAPIIGLSIGSTGVVGNIVSVLGTYQASSATQSMFAISPNINQSGTAGYTIFTINATETGTGSGVRNIADFRIGGITRFAISPNGVVTASALILTGSGGEGYIQLGSQSSAPSIDGSGSIRLYSNVNGDFSWRDDSLYTKTIVGHTHTANRTYTLPDADGTIVLNDNTASLTNKTISGLTNTITNIQTSSLPAAALQGYTLPIQGALTNPADNTTYYMGFNGTTGISSIAAVNRIYLPKAGTITRANVFILNATATGSAQTSSMYVTLNNTTNYLISSNITVSSSVQNFSNTTMSVPIADNFADYIEIKWVTPTWTTNPQGTRLTVNLYIE